MINWTIIFYGKLGDKRWEPDGIKMIKKTERQLFFCSLWNQNVWKGNVINSKDMCSVLPPKVPGYCDKLLHLCLLDNAGRNM